MSVRFLWLFLVSLLTVSITAQTSALTERHTFESGASFAYPATWTPASVSTATITLTSGDSALTIRDYPALQAQGFSINSSISAVLDYAFDETVIDLKEAFDPAGMRVVPLGSRGGVIYTHDDGIAAYGWAHVSFTNGAYGLITMTAPATTGVDEPLLIAIAETFDNANDPGNASSQSGGRADLARELIEMEILGPLRSLFTDDDFEFAFAYPDDESWSITVRDTGEVIAAHEDTTITFFGASFFQLNNLSGAPTLDDLVQSAMTRFGTYEIDTSFVFKANGRPALQVETFAPDGSPVIFVGVTFSDERFGLATVQTDDALLLEEIVYLMLDSFDIRPFDVGDISRLYFAPDLSYGVLYPEGWTLEDVPQGGYIAVSDGDIAINIYGPAGVALLGLAGIGDVMTFVEEVIALIGWEFDPPGRLRIDNRPVARLIYENPVYETQGRLYAIVLDNATRRIGYFDVVPLSASANVAPYEQAIFEMLESFKTLETN